MGLGLGHQWLGCKGRMSQCRHQLVTNAPFPEMTNPSVEVEWIYELSDREHEVGFTSHARNTSSQGMEAVGWSYGELQRVDTNCCRTRHKSVPDPSRCCNY